MQLLRHLVTVTRLCLGSPCASSITTLVYTACPRVRGSSCGLSCYVFVCFGNGFQVTIVPYVTWWLMGKIHLLLTTPFPPQATLAWTHSKKDEFHPSLLQKWLTGIRMFTFLDQRAVPLNQEGDLSENKVECVWLWQCSLQREGWDYMRGRFGGPSIHRSCHPMGED